MECFVFTEKPDDFQPAVQASGCYCLFEDKILMVLRHPGRPQGLKWALPAGKLEKGETARDAVIREIKEEVGLFIDDENLQSIGKLYCRLPHVDYIFHTFLKQFNQLPLIELELQEHLAFKWVTFKEALQLPLIAGGRESLLHYQQILSQIDK